jgi:hypothetical protein
MIRDRVHRENRTIYRMVISGLVYMLFWAGLYVKGYLSPYYYYRNYAVMWALAWLMTAHVIHLLAEQKQQMLAVSYGGFYLLVILLSFGRVDTSIEEISQDFYSTSPSGRGMVPLYSANAQSLAEAGGSLIGEQMYDLLQYRIDEMEGEDVPLITAEWMQISSTWYQSVSLLSGGAAQIFYTQTSFADALEQLDERESEYVLVSKRSVDASHVAKLEEKCEVIKENAEGAIYRKSGDTWSEIMDTYENVSEDSVALENHITEQIGYNRAMLLCETDYSGAGDWDELRAYTGDMVLDYVGRVESDLLRAYLPTLDENGVQYLVVYKDSQMYRENQEYFEAQAVEYENGLALVVAPAGDGWEIKKQ